MKNFVIINGVNSNTINGLGINELPPISKPSMRVLTEEIDGRDGDITTNLGYSAYDKTITIGLFGTGYDINNIISFFNGEGTIVFSNEDDKYYKYKIINQIDYEALLKFKQATITFHCQPFKYPTSETPLEIEYDYIEQTGETLTLNNTGESILDLSLKGNTSQIQYSGKNLYAFGDLSISSSYYFENKKLLNNYENNTTYTLSFDINSSQTPFNISIGYGNDSYVTDGFDWYNKANGHIVVTFTTNRDDYSNLWIRIPRFNNSGTSWTATITNIQLEKNNQETSFEPYTGGIASPNPSYPQPINVVTGDNEVVVCGKNLLSSSFEQVSANTIACNIDNFPSGTYTFSTQVATAPHEIQVKVKKGGSYERLIAQINSKTITFTLDTTKNIRIEMWKSNGNPLSDYSNFMLNEGNEATTYKPYQSQTYPINLPVKNYLDNSKTSSVADTLTTTYISGTRYRIQGLTSGNKVFMTSLGIPSDTYTLSITLVSGSYSGGNLVIQDQNNTTLGELTIGTLGTKVSKTITGTIGRLILWNTSTFDGTFDIQIEKGTKSNNYIEYNQTPIELNKIGDYQDYITKNSGKNLFDGEIEAGYLDVNDGTEKPTYNVRTKNYVEIQPNTQYTISDNNQGKDTWACYYNQSKTFISSEKIKVSTNQSGTFTTPNNAYYIRWYNATSTGTSPLWQLELGNTATPYEPYGTGQWCKYNAIGKVVLDGTENWNRAETNNIARFEISSIDYKKGTSYYTNLIPLFSNNFTLYSFSDIYGGTKTGVAYWWNTTTKIILFDFQDDRTLETFTTWLSTHNTIVYYVLATPYLSLIEDTTLISQLDNIQNAMSYEGQTNVMQVNNDKPFIISAKALEQGSDEVVVNNIGNATSKPLIALEGTGNINIYLDGTQVLQANVVDKMNIDIDKLEAYNPDTSALLNRQVTGNYNSMTIPSGESIIKIDGALDKATITNYQRWL